MFSPTHTPFHHVFRINYALRTVSFSVIFYPGGGGGGYSPEILGGGVPPGSSNPDPISDLNMPFSTPVFRPDL